MRQQLLMMESDPKILVLEEQVKVLKKHNAELEARIMGLKQAYMTTLEEFKTYRQEFELQQCEKKPDERMPPQLELHLDVNKPNHSQKEIELPPIVTRLKNRLVARKAETSTFNLRKVSEKAITSQERNAHQHGLSLALRIIPGTIEELIGDPAAFELLISNLLRLNSQATSDGFVSIAASVETKGNNDGKLILTFENNGCSRSLHPWTNWIPNPYQADFHENELAAEWCAQLIEQLGGSFDVDDIQTHIACRLILPVTLPRAQKTEKCGPFKGETAAILDGNVKRRQIIIEQLQAWGLNIEAAPSASEISPNARVLIITEPQRRSEELDALTTGNPKLAILRGDINRSDKFIKQLMTALDYKPPVVDQPDLFG